MEKELYELSKDLDIIAMKIRHLSKESGNTIRQTGYDLFLKKYKRNEHNNITRLALSCGVSRVTVYKWISQL